MFSRDAAAQIDAAIQDFLTCFNDPTNLIRIAFVEQQDRMNVSIAGMKDVDNTDIMTMPDLRDEIRTEVGRSHEQAGRCAKCGFREMCERKLV